MNSFSNDEAIQLFQSVNETNKEKIHNEIFSKLSFLVYQIAKPYKKFQNYEDILQEGFIGLLKSVRKFDYSKYPNFFLYSYQWIKHSIKRSASKFDIVYNPSKKRVVYADFSEQEEQEDPNYLEELYFEKEVAIKIRNILNTLPSREKIIMEKTFGIKSEDCESLRNIGSQLDITHERVRQIKNETIEKLKNNPTIIDIK